MECLQHRAVHFQLTMVKSDVYTVVPISKYGVPMTTGTDGATPVLSYTGEDL